MSDCKITCPACSRDLANFNTCPSKICRPRAMLLKIRRLYPDGDALALLKKDILMQVPGKGIAELSDGIHSVAWTEPGIGQVLFTVDIPQPEEKVREPDEEVPSDDDANTVEMEPTDLSSGESADDVVQVPESDVVKQLVDEMMDYRDPPKDYVPPSAYVINKLTDEQTKQLMENAAAASAPATLVQATAKPTTLDQGLLIDAAFEIDALVSSLSQVITSPNGLAIPIENGWVINKEAFDDLVRLRQRFMKRLQELSSTPR